MLVPTLLHQSRTPDPDVVRDPALVRALSAQDWRRRVAAEARPEPSGDAPPRSFGMKRAATADPDLGRRILERIIKGNDLVPVNYLERGVACARAVCRVRLLNSVRQTVGFATGCLVARGVLLTNQHVLPTTDHVRYACAEFGYEHDVLGGDRVPVTFEFDTAVRPIVRGDLDFCLAAVMPRAIDGSTALDDFGWLTLDPTPGKTRRNEYLTIIQHPAGERKQVCVRENKLVDYVGHTLWYQTDTVSGSSGSPVFNNSWQVVALHHSGVPLTNGKGQILTTDRHVFRAGKMKESQIAWLANAGIRISSILEALRAEHADHESARAVLAGAPSPVHRPVFTDGVRGASVTVPVIVGGPQWGGADGRPPAAVARRARVTVSGVPSAVSEDWRLEAAVKKPPVGAITSYPSRDGDDLSDRKGYREDFLGTGTLRVTVPRIAKNFPFNAPMTWGPGGQKTVLPYDRHSVLLSNQRRLAIWSAVNVDDNRRYSQPSNDPKWINDPRLNGREVGDEFYEPSPGVRAVGQSERRKSPFDRGHQVQQEDATWGKTPAAAARSSVDTFYFPNAAPQVFDFNQKGKAWQGLEDYCIEVFAAETRRACVITGAVFDAPRATGTPRGGTLALPINPRGARSPDPKFLGVRVPKAFYKIVVCSDGQRLRAAAFLMSQQFQLDRFKGTPIVDALETLTTEQARIFFVKAQDVTALTGLDFGINVRNAQATTLEAIELGQGTSPGHEVRSLADLRL
jgi:endonuclease G